MKLLSWNFVNSLPGFSSSASFSLLCRVPGERNLHKFPHLDQIEVCQHEHRSCQHRRRWVLKLSELVISEFNLNSLDEHSLTFWAAAQFLTFTKYWRISNVVSNESSASPLIYLLIRLHNIWISICITKALLLWPAIKSDTSSLFRLRTLALS